MRLTGTVLTGTRSLEAEVIARSVPACVRSRTVCTSSSRTLNLCGSAPTSHASPDYAKAVFGNLTIRFPGAPILHWRLQRARSEAINIKVRIQLRFEPE